MEGKLALSLQFSSFLVSFFGFVLFLEEEEEQNIERV